jgi:hypothetical protein
MKLPQSLIDRGLVLDIPQFRPLFHGYSTGQWESTNPSQWPDAITDALNTLDETYRATVVRIHIVSIHDALYIPP